MKFMRWILQQKNETAQKSDKWNFPYDILRRLVFIYIRSGFNVSVISSGAQLSCQFGWTAEKLLSLFLPVGHFNRKPANDLISFWVNCVNFLLFFTWKCKGLDGVWAFKQQCIEKAIYLTWICWYDRVTSWSEIQKIKTGKIRLFLCFLIVWIYEKRLFSFCMTEIHTSRWNLPKYTHRLHTLYSERSKPIWKKVCALVLWSIYK